MLQRLPGRAHVCPCRDSSAPGAGRVHQGPCASAWRYPTTQQSVGLLFRQLEPLLYRWGSQVRVWVLGGTTGKLPG